MRMAGMTILVVPTAADARYLTQLGPEVAVAILSLDQDPTAFTASSPGQVREQSWITDLRPAPRGLTAAIVDRLAELHADRTIVGVVGLDGSGPLPEGSLNYTTFIALREVFSHARWVGATSLLQEVRAVKSAEEIAILTRAAVAADAALSAGAAAAGPAATGRELWIAMAQEAVRAGADPPPGIDLTLGDTDDEWDTALGQEGGLTAEVRIACNGYRSRSTQSWIIEPVTSSGRTLQDRLAACWDTLWPTLRPSTPVSSLAALAHGSSSADCVIGIELRGLGLGADLPDFPPPATYRPRDEPFLLREGLCCFLRVTASAPDVQLARGESVIVTGSGLRSLGPRRNAPLVIG
jgi:hypothetical protein